MRKGIGQAMLIAIVLSACSLGEAGRRQSRWHWAYAIGYCAPGAEEVIVLDSAGRGS